MGCATGASAYWIVDLAAVERAWAGGLMGVSVAYFSVYRQCKIHKTVALSAHARTRVHACRVLLDSQQSVPIISLRVEKTKKIRYLL